MCGIFCELDENKTTTSGCSGPLQENQVFDKCRTNLERRGPNSVREVKIDGIRFFGTVKFISRFVSQLKKKLCQVFHHQGLKPTAQPIVKCNFVLLFNGDLFMDLNLNGQSDTDHLAFLLDNITDESDLRKVIGTLRGPYSLIYYNRTWKKLFFVRDGMGRNSLLIGSVNGNFFVSSVCCYDLADCVAEVPPIGLYCFNVNNNELSVSPWYDTESHPFYEEQIEILNSKIKRSLLVRGGETIFLPWLNLLQIVRHCSSFQLINFSDIFLIVILGQFHPR